MRNHAAARVDLAVGGARRPDFARRVHASPHPVPCQPRWQHPRRKAGKLQRTGADDVQRGRRIAARERRDRQRHAVVHAQHMCARRQRQRRERDVHRRVAGRADGRKTRTRRQDERRRDRGRERDRRRRAGVPDGQRRRADWRRREDELAHAALLEGGGLRERQDAIRRLARARIAKRTSRQRHAIARAERAGFARRTDPRDLERPRRHGRVRRAEEVAGHLQDARALGIKRIAVLPRVGREIARDRQRLPLRDVEVRRPVRCVDPQFAVAVNQEVAVRQKRTCPLAVPGHVEELARIDPHMLPEAGVRRRDAAVAVLFGFRRAVRHIGSARHLQQEVHDKAVRVEVLGPADLARAPQRLRQRCPTRRVLETTDGADVAHLQRGQPVVAQDKGTASAGTSRARRQHGVDGRLRRHARLHADAPAAFKRQGRPTPCRLAEDERTVGAGLDHDVGDRVESAQPDRRTDVGSIRATPYIGRSSRRSSVGDS